MPLQLHNFRLADAPAFAQFRAGRCSCICKFSGWQMPLSGWQMAMYNLRSEIVPCFIFELGDCPGGCEVPFRAEIRAERLPNAEIMHCGTFGLPYCPGLRYCPATLGLKAGPGCQIYVDCSDLGLVRFATVEILVDMS